MRLHVGNIWTSIESGYAELNAARSALTFIEDNGLPVVLINDGAFLTGLVSVFLKRLDSSVPVTVLEQPPKIPAQDIKIDPSMLNGITLRDYQVSAALKMVHHKRGFVDIPPGGGKTELSIAVVKYLLDEGHIKNCLYLVDRVHNLKQTVKRFKDRAGITCGVVTPKETDLEKPVVIAMVPTLYRRIKRKDADLKFDCILGDEVHHLPSSSWSSIYVSCSAGYRFGVSGTPMSQPIPDPITIRDHLLVGMTGDCIVKVPSSLLVRRGYLAKPVVTFLPAPGEKFWVKDWRKAYNRGLRDNEAYHSYVARLAKSISNKGLRVLILVTQVEHGKSILRHMYNELGYEAPLFKGDEESVYFTGREFEAKPCDLKSIGEFYKTEGAVAVASPVLRESVDFSGDVEVNAVVYAGGMKSYRYALQGFGRGMRPKPGDNTAWLFDFYHNSHPYLKSHSGKRERTYRSEGYAVVHGLNTFVSRYGPLTL